MLVLLLLKLKNSKDLQEYIYGTVTCITMFVFVYVMILFVACI